VGQLAVLNVTVLELVLVNVQLVQVKVMVVFASRSAPGQPPATLVK
jgi:hypothetical protein